MLSQEEVLQQSRGAMKQWESMWKEHAAENGRILKEKGYSNQRIFGHGIGRKLICCAVGNGLKDQLENLRNKPEHYDIATVDKSFGYLLDNGIKPNFVYVADAIVDFDKWGKPWIDQTEDVCLFLNVCANPKWAQNWKGKVFYFVNQDNIQTEKIFAPISGCNELLKASSSTGNTVVVHAATYMIYDEYIMVGYEHSWGDDDLYYIAEDSEKRWYMNHIQILSNDGQLVSTSQNLFFTVRWLGDFIQAELLPKGKKIFTTSKRGILKVPYKNLAKEFKTFKGRQIKEEELNMVIQNRLQPIIIRPVDGKDKLQEALQNNKVFEIIVRHLPDDLFPEVAHA
jgi:hypothetical protein